MVINLYQSHSAAMYIEEADVALFHLQIHRPSMLVKKVRFITTEQDL